MPLKPAYRLLQQLKISVDNEWVSSHLLILDNFDGNRNSTRLIGCEIHTPLMSRFPGCSDDIYNSGKHSMLRLSSFAFLDRVVLCTSGFRFVASDNIMVNLVL
jgi:hypothetical protein